MDPPDFRGRKPRGEGLAKTLKDFGARYQATLMALRAERAWTAEEAYVAPELCLPRERPVNCHGGPRADAPCGGW